METDTYYDLGNLHESTSPVYQSMDGFGFENAVIFDGPPPLKVASNLAPELSSRFERLLELLKHPQEHEEVCLLQSCAFSPD